MADPAQPAPMFSVLIATYNHAQYICEALDSVAAQSFSDYEIVIIDDGSTDGTATAVRRWMGNFAQRRANRVVLLQTANGGQSAALEHGIGACTGSYVCLLDSDDRWLPAKLEAVRRIAQAQPDVVMICHPVLVMGPTGALTGKIRPSRARLSRGDLRAQVRRTGRSVAAVTSGVTVRRDVLRGLIPFPTKSFRFGADGYITTGASLCGPVEITSQPLALYRVHSHGQYFTRMLSEDGPRQAMELHLTIARHFGIEPSVRRSSYFTRHAFAEAKLHGAGSDGLREYGHLLQATIHDDAFSLPSRIALGAFWTACLMLPRPLFLLLWRRFQMRHMGMETTAAPAGSLGNEPQARRR
jgi:hypothetical protein